MPDRSFEQADFREQWDEHPAASFRRQSWVREGSPLWAFMCLLDFIDWTVRCAAEAVVWLKGKVRNVGR